MHVTVIQVADLKSFRAFLKIGTIGQAILGFHKPGKGMACLRCNGQVLMSDTCPKGHETPFEVSVLRDKRASEIRDVRHTFSKCLTNVLESKSL